MMLSGMTRIGTFIGKLEILYPSEPPFIAFAHGTKHRERKYIIIKRKVSPSTV